MIKGKIYLTQVQKEMAVKIGRARCAAKPKSVRYNDSGFHNYNSDRSYPHVLGAACEVIYSYISKIPMDERIMEHGDEVDFNGVEIKGSTWIGDDIELKIKKSEYFRKIPSAYNLCRVDKKLEWVEFIGCISRKRFDIIKKSKKHKFVENWVVEAKDLKKSIIKIEDGKIPF